MNILNNILLRVEKFSPSYILFIDLLICLALSIFIYILGKLLFIRYKNTYKFSFIKSFKLTLYLIIWSYFIKTCLDLPTIIYLPDYKEQIILYSDKLFDFCIYIAIIISLFKFLKDSKDIAVNNKKETTKDSYEDFRDINAIFKALNLGAIAISIILILAAFRVPPTALGAFSGVALAGLTLSQSTLLTNLFGGLFVIFNRKYSEGDTIYSEINSSIKFKGKVKRIGILTTQIDSYETTPMHIPNSVFLNTCISNSSRRTHRRILQTITIDYKHIKDIEYIKDKIYDILKSHKYVDQSKRLIVSLASGGSIIGSRQEGSYGANGINIEIYALVPKVFLEDFKEIQDDIFIKIAQALYKDNIIFAINPVTLRTKQN